MNNFLILCILLTISIFSEARTVDCGKPCKEVFEVDIKGAADFGIIVVKDTLSSPPITRIEISDRNKYVCSTGWLEVSIGHSDNSNGPEVITGYKEVAHFSSITINNDLVKGSRLFLGVDCIGTKKEEHWKKGAQNTVLSISLE